jgi:hypothetical protein
MKFSLAEAGKYIFSLNLSLSEVMMAIVTDEFDFI